MSRRNALALTALRGSSVVLVVICFLVTCQLTAQEVATPQATATSSGADKSDTDREKTATEQNELAKPIVLPNASSVDTSAEGEVAEGEQEPEELPEGYQEELDLRIKLFQKLRVELENAIIDQRTTYILYANREQYGPQYRRAYTKQRAHARSMMSKVYDAALDVLRMGFDEEAITYMVTMLQHRHEIGFYDNQTLEGAARLIDGGSNLQYMFEVAARSAVVCGQFDMAKQLYEALPDEDQQKIDLRLEFSIDDLKKEYEIEAKRRLAEAEADNLPRVSFKTTQGDFVVELFLEQAPSTVSHFIKLVEDGFYDGKDFFQVIEHLLALVGEPDFDPSDRSIRFLVDENQRADARPGLRGALVMAKVPNEEEETQNFFPNSASNQFAILLTPVYNAQKDQTVFGTVIEGMETVSRLIRVDPHEEKKKGEEKVPPDSIIEATVLRRPETLPSPVYVN